MTESPPPQHGSQEASLIAPVTTREGVRRSWALALAVLLMAGLPSGCASAEVEPAAGGKAGPVKGIWVTRWDYATVEDIAAIMKNVADTGLNTVFFQVRGEGTVFYPSALEPLDARWKPGKEADALKTAVQEARKRKLAIHAWVNVMPVWRGAAKPPFANHIVNAHPDWLMVDAAGVRMKPQEGYIYVTPGREDVRKHLAAVAKEIATRYDVDGVHLDYIRFPEKKYSYDSVSLSAFRELTGQTPKQNPVNWDEFRRRQVTETLKVIRAGVDGKKGPLLSAAVWGDYDIGSATYLQDTRHWVEAGLLDFTAPMIYTTTHADYERRLKKHLTFRKGFPVYAGIGAYKFTEAKQPFAGIARQMDFARDSGGGGYVLFAYSSFFADHKPNAYGQALKKKLRPT